MTDKIVLWLLVGWIGLDLIASILRLLLSVIENEAGKAVILSLSIIGTLVLIAHVIDMARRAA